MNLTYEPTHYNLVNNQSNPVAYKQISVSKPQPLGPVAMARVIQLQAQANRIAMQPTHQQVSHVLDQLALSQGLPTYKEFHAQNGIPYPAPSDPGTLGIAKVQAAQQRANPPVQTPPVRLSDYSSLEHAQAAQNLLNYQAQVFENQRQAMLAEQQRQAAHIAWANQKAAELCQQYAPQSLIAWQRPLQTRNMSAQAQARQIAPISTTKAKLENDFKAEINSRLEKQMKELFSITGLPDAFVIQKKEREFSNYIFKNYLLDKKGDAQLLNWYQLSAIVGYLANHTDTDAEFKTVLWGLFGATIPNEHTPLLTRFVDNKNPGLQEKCLNDGYDQEQIHHYLGGVTGDFYDSHKYNNWFGSTYQELDETARTGRWNQGDWLLFQHSQSHRDDFVKGTVNNKGRFTVAGNMRKLLKPPATE